VIGFFGIRGIGSLYYLAYALSDQEFPQPEELWAVTGLVILVSVVVHGIAATPVMERLDRNRERTGSARLGRAT
jgi:NhaP-type Na+/H+ or K+/H+ antiporter